MGKPNFKIILVYMNELEESIKNVNSREDFIRFIDALMNDLKTNPDQWENKTLPDYLSAIQSWTAPFPMPQSGHRGTWMQSKQMPNQYLLPHPRC